MPKLFTKRKNNARLTFSVGGTTWAITWAFAIRATSDMRLRAHDNYTSSTLIGGKGGAGPSSLHTTLEGPMEHVNAR